MSTVRYISDDDAKVLEHWRRATVAERKAMLFAMSVLFAREGKPWTRENFKVFEGSLVEDGR